MDLSEVRGLFEAAVAAGGEAQAMANWVLGPVQAQRNADGGVLHLEGAHLAALEALVSAGTVNRSTARDLLVEVMVSGSDPVALVAERGLSQISDDGAIQAAVDQVLGAQEEAVRRYGEGQQRVLGFLIGQVMRAFDGRADPATVRLLLEASLRAATDSVVSSGSTESGA
jgi:Asp-tRNA(Asn)/Glu-tRNA(Gln) amidotransferase B subunit